MGWIIMLVAIGISIWSFSGGKKLTPKEPAQSDSRGHSSSLYVAIGLLVALGGAAYIVQLWLGARVASPPQVPVDPIEEARAYYYKVQAELAASTPPTIPAQAVATSIKATPVEGWTACQHFVEGRLVAPGTAKYPWRSIAEFTTNLGPKGFRFSNYVDSQNAYSALVRTHFICEVVPEGDQWVLKRLELQ